MTEDVKRSSVGVLAAVAAELDAGNILGAIKVAEGAVGIADQQLDALAAIAALAFRQGNVTNAINILGTIVDQCGKNSDVPEALAVLHCMAGQVTDALYYGKLATVVKPDGRLIPLFGSTFPNFADAFLRIEDRPFFRKAVIAFDAGHSDAAIHELEQHLQAFAGDVEALDLYANALAHLGRYREAVGILQTVMTVGGHSATLLSRLGRNLVALGAFDAGIACHRAALARAPKATALWAACVLDWEYSPWGQSDARQQAVDGLLGALAAAAPKTTRKPRQAAEKAILTIGLLCGPGNDGDIKEMIGRLAASFDRGTTEIVGFGPGELDDASNISWRGTFNRWRNIANVDELTLSALIRGEGVDVIVDTEGLLANDRHGLFQRQCAPLQFTWLNMPQGFAVPGAHGSLAWDAETGCGPLLLSIAGAGNSKLPAIVQGSVTFGADVNLAELNAELVRAWATILLAVPDSKLVLLDRGFSNDVAATEQLIELFGSFGVAHCIDVVPADVDQAFSGVDIALAPFPVARVHPYGRALSQGVPVIAYGGLVAGAVAATGVAVERMIAADVEDYVAKAQQWVDDLDALAAFRTETPAKVAASAVFQPALFARAWEQMFKARKAALAAIPAG
ncbi:MAG: hypothetical protein H7Y60_05190 [Rhodospirillaceae bacterium]|nr:hypothetical protein [Rhodospirillales bacterium]